jgi:hypothetical protein
LELYNIKNMEAIKKRDNSIPILLTVFGILFLMIGLSAAQRYPVYWGDIDFIVYFSISLGTFVGGILGIIFCKWFFKRK